MKVKLEIKSVEKQDYRLARLLHLYEVAKVHIKLERVHAMALIVILEMVMVGGYVMA